MYKVLDFDPYGFDGEPVVFPANGGLLKQASGDLHEEIRRFIAKDHINPEEYSRVVICSLGAFDAYGPNNNGDAFFEEDLLRIHPREGVPVYKTYEIYGKPYKFHKNRPGDKAYGRVVLAVYNEKMKRLELVVDFSRKDAPDVCEDIDSGILPKVSMGFDAEYDVCSICGNKATKRSEYCEHARHQMLRILPDGRMVYVRNPIGKFFDISIVRIPADNIATVMKKVAHRRGERVFTKLSADRAAEEGYVDHKRANIKKRVPASIAKVVVPDDHKQFIRNGVPLLQRMEQDMPRELIEEISKYPLREIISTMVLFGIRLKPKEFQRIILTKEGHPELADELESSGIVFPVDYENAPDNKFTPSGKFANFSLANIIAEHPHVVRNRSYHLPYLAKRAFQEEADRFPNANIRIMRPKRERVDSNDDDQYSLRSVSDRVMQYVDSKNPIKTLIGLGALYAGINWLSKRSDTSFDRFLRKYPHLVLPVVGSAIIAAEFGRRQVDKRLEKTSASKNPLNSWFFRTLVTAPAVYTLGYYADKKRERGDRVNIVLDSMSKNPVLWTALGAVALGKLNSEAVRMLERHLKKTAAIDVDYVFEYPNELLGEVIISRINKMI